MSNKQSLQRVYDLECALIPAVVEMEHTGMLVDQEQALAAIAQLEEEIGISRGEFLEVLDSQLRELHGEGLPREPDGTFNLRAKKALKRDGGAPAGFNINSPAQVIKNLQLVGIEPVDPKTEKPSTDKKVLRPLADNPVVFSLLAYKRAEKRRSMIQSWLDKNIEDDGRIHARFAPLNTGTGRFSCVAGNTVLITSRGDFTFEEYLPLEGDLVLTHEGRWMPVVRKLYRGVEETIELVTTEGAKLTCTRDHKLLSQGRWVTARSLCPGDPLEYFPQLDQRRGQHQSGGGSLQGRGQAHHERGGIGAGDDTPKRSVCASDAFAPRRAACRAGAAVLTRQGREAQSDVRQEWFPAPQLQGLSSRPQGVSDRAGWLWWPGVPAPFGNGAGDWSREVALTSGGASHRRQPPQQQLGQLGPGDEQGAQRLAPSTTRVVSVNPVGAMGVWDIEVLGDHSYALYGFLSHNCSAPNLQQVPRESYIRDCFIAADGYELVVMDVKNMEMGVACCEPIANELLMQNALRDGVDLHTLTGHLMFGVPLEDVSRDQRQRSKSCNFSLLFGSGAQGLKDYFAASGVTITLDEATEFRKAWLAAYPAMAEWHRKAKWECEKGEVRMVDGRRRWLVGEQAKPTVWLNNLVQGTAASIVKATMVGIWPRLPKDARLVAQIHDELIVETPEGSGEEVLEIMKAQLLLAGRLIIGDSVDMVGEGSVAKSWGQAK